MPLSIGVWKAAASCAEANQEDEPTTTCLFGELNLASGLVPSFSFGIFEAKYVVELLPFNVAGFEPAASQERLLRKEILTAVNYGDGPKPRAYLPPGYIAARERVRAAVAGRGASNSGTSTRS